MLSSEQNKLLTEVCGEAPMGQLLRRYWHPIAGWSELDDRPTKAIRVFGEDLVLFKDLSGRPGLVGRRCPHRGADLALGIPEASGLRCVYHGWRFDSDGKCVEQPFEERLRPDGAFKEKCGTRAYPVRIESGIVWAYFGPQPAPCFPDWDFFSARVHKVVNVHEVPCNWLQCQENSLDPIHFEWLHDYWTWARESRRPGSDANAEPPIRTHLRIEFEEFEWGFRYRRLRDGDSEAEADWAIGRVSLWPNAFYAGAVTWYVPIDDENTLVVGLLPFALPDDEPLEQDRIPTWHAPITDEAGNPRTDSLYNQDTATWTGQGRIADRTEERLGESDRGVIMFRRRLLEEVLALAPGRDPKGILRDEGRNRRIELPKSSFYSRSGFSDPDKAPARAFVVGFPAEFLPKPKSG